jgi:hypothetical protein
MDNLRFAKARDLIGDQRSYSAIWFPTKIIEKAAQ